MSIRGRLGRARGGIGESSGGHPWCVWENWQAFGGMFRRTCGCHLGLRKIVKLRAASDKAFVSVRGRLGRARGGIRESLRRHLGCVWGDSGFRKGRRIGSCWGQEDERDKDGSSWVPSCLSKGSGIRSGFRVQGSGFRVKGLWTKTYEGQNLTATKAPTVGQNRF